MRNIHWLTLLIGLVVGWMLAGFIATSSSTVSSS